MGGNVQIKDKGADRIDLTKISRNEFVKELTKSLVAINSAFDKETGFHLWVAPVFKSKSFLSGSAYHFFDENIADEEFVSYKDSVGDIDTQVNGLHQKEIEAFLNKNEGNTFGDLELVGFKKSANQYISLWTSSKFKINIQVDFEMVDFDENGHPTPWSSFSHSSAWEDMKVGVKGVAHKYLYRALSAKDLKTVIIKAKTSRGSDKEVMSAEVAFSPSGFRRKLKPVLDDKGAHVHERGIPVYQELTTKETGFITDLDAIFEAFFGHLPSAQEKAKMESFTGTLDLVNENYNATQKRHVADGFANTLWGPGAQSLYRDDQERDLREKTVMMGVLCKKLDINEKSFTMIKTRYYKG